MEEDQAPLPETCSACTRAPKYTCRICDKVFCHQKTGCKETLLHHPCTDVEAGVEQTGKPPPSKG